LFVHADDAGDIPLFRSMHDRAEDSDKSNFYGSN